MKTPDDLVALRGWVEQSMGIIENKNYGFQDFSLIANDGSTDSEAVGKLPYDGNSH